MKYKMVHAATSGYTVKKLLSPQLRALIKTGSVDLYVMAGPDEEAQKLVEEMGAKYIPIRMDREISILKDFAALVQILKILRLIKPRIVCAGTPKASLLILVASFALRIKRRVYFLRGLRLEGTFGVKRRILWIAEFLTAACSTHIVSVSPSLKTSFCSAGLANPDKVHVLGQGSSKGVDLNRFRPRHESNFSGSAGSNSRHSPKPPFRIGFVGRLTREKGVFDAIEVYKMIQKTYREVSLTIAGPNESSSEDSELLNSMHGDQGLEFLGPIEHCHLLFPDIDVLLLPSSREGLPNVVIEAAACGTPTIAYSVTGTIDTICDGKTGFLVADGDTAGMAQKVERYLKSPKLLRNHGRSARDFAAANFDQDLVNSLYSDYFILLASHRPIGR